MKHKKMWFVATYGDLGLDVEHFTEPLAYGRAIRRAERGYYRDDFDTYTFGEVPTRS